MKKLLTLFSLLILLFFSDIEARQNPQTCSSSCGDIHNINYPFRLLDDPINCGDPDFQLSCQNNKTILNFHGGLYYVKKISYSNHKLHLVDVNFENNNSCNLPYKSLSSDEIMADSRYHGGTTNYNHSYDLNYIRCSKNISNLINTISVPCLSTNTSQIYININSHTSFPYEVPNSCKIFATTQALYENKVELSYETVLKMQESGFEMIWSVECRDCWKKGRGCVYKTKDTDFLFKCEEEYGYDDEIRDVLIFFAWVLLSGIIGFVRFVLLPLVVFVFLLHKCINTRN